MSERPSKLPKFLGYSFGAIALSPFIYAGYLLVRGANFAHKHPGLTITGMLTAGTLAYTLPKIDFETALQERIANTQTIEQLETQVTRLEQENAQLTSAYTAQTQGEVPSAPPPEPYTNLENILQEPEETSQESKENLSRFLSGVAFGVGGTFLVGLGLSYLNTPSPTIPPPSAQTYARPSRQRGRQIR